MTRELKIITARMTGMTMNPFEELFARNAMTTMHAAMARTPNHPLMNLALRSRISTRVPAGPTGPGAGSLD